MGYTQMDYMGLAGAGADPNVAAMQAQINRFGGNLNVDGAVGDNTMAALKAALTMAMMTAPVSAGIYRAMATIPLIVTQNAKAYASNLKAWADAMLLPSAGQVGPGGGGVSIVPAQVMEPSGIPGFDMELFGLPMPVVVAGGAVLGVMAYKKYVKKG